jgi:arsenite methyltransferase
MELPATRASTSDSLFERCAWIYALCREYLFRDHTEEISQALLPDGRPAAGRHFVELGCGPGFYCCKFAECFPDLRATGVDLSEKLLRRAKHRAASRRLANCNFLRGDAHGLPLESNEVDGVIVSRLFLIIVKQREQVMAEVQRVLRGGGRCFIAEPTSGFRTRIPLALMWVLSKLTSSPAGKYREPRQAEVMSAAEFRMLVESQPWASVQFFNDGWYQYAVCEKAGGGE